MNLIDNHSFEDGLAPWSAAFGGNLSITSDEAHTGVQSAVASGRTETYHGPVYDLTPVMSPLGQYSAMAFGRIANAPSDTLRLTTKRTCAGQEAEYLMIAQAPATDTDWTELSGIIDVPSFEDCDLLELLLYVEGPPAGVDILIDTASVAPF